MNKKKKGALTIFAIFVIIAFLVFVAVMFNLQQGMQMVTRMHQAAEEGARVRAQAIDILLKEQEGIIEVLHDSQNYSDNVKHSEHINVSGHVNPNLPQSAQYTNAKLAANAFAKESVITYVNTAIAKDISEKKRQVSLTTDDICFAFKPLPDGSLYDDSFDPEEADDDELNKTYKMDFSCTTPNGDTIKAYNVPVSGVKKNTVKVGKKADGSVETVKVANVVFIGVHFEYSYFVNKIFRDFGLDDTDEADVWAIAYPQVDKCVWKDADSCGD